MQSHESLYLPENIPKQKETCDLQGPVFFDPSKKGKKQNVYQFFYDPQQI